MAKYKVTFDVILPEGITFTQKQLIDWLRFELKSGAELSHLNPLSDYELEAEYSSVEARKE